MALNPHYQFFIVSCQLSVVSSPLLNLFMQGVMPTPLAVFLELQTIRHVPLVLRGSVIPAVALCTLERDVFLHCRAFLPSCFRAFVFLGKHTLTDDSSWLLSVVCCLLFHNL